MPLVSCSGAGKGETVPLRIGDAVFQVEIADTPEERRVGLMNRASMPDDHGMLFVFPEDEWLSFWMKNTTIPLSIAYIDSSGLIREIYDMEPLSEASVESRGSRRYALEVNQGAFAVRGVTVGMQVELPSQVTGAQ